MNAQAPPAKKLLAISPALGRSVERSNLNGLDCSWLLTAGTLEDKSKWQTAIESNASLVLTPEPLLHNWIAWLTDVTLDLHSPKGLVRCVPFTRNDHHPTRKADAGNAVQFALLVLDSTAYSIARLPCHTCIGEVDLICFLHTHGIVNDNLVVSIGHAFACAFHAWLSSRCAVSTRKISEVAVAIPKTVAAKGVPSGYDDQLQIVEMCDGRERRNPNGIDNLDLFNLHKPVEARKCCDGVKQRECKALEIR
jgi:hypothetical protein